MRRWMGRGAAIIALLALGMGCAGESAGQPAAECGESGERLELADGSAYCAFRGPIIETRFSCPDAYPHENRPGEGLLVCGQEPGMLPGELIGRLEDDGLLDEGWELSEESPQQSPDMAPEMMQPPDMGSNPVLPPPQGQRIPAQQIADELARMLWNQQPDAQLQAAVADGSLDTRAGVAQQVQRMIADPRARVWFMELWREYLQLEKTEMAMPDAAQYPGWTPMHSLELALSVEHQIEEHIWSQKKDFRQLFAGQEIFLNERLAPFYGVDPTTLGPDFTPVSMPATEPRAGLVSHPAFMLRTQTNITKRGAFAMNLMCMTVPPPPPDVNFPSTNVPNQGSEREQLEAATSAPECAGCHQMPDPSGFALQNYDAIGAWRAVDGNGMPIDSSGGFMGFPANNAAELAQVLNMHGELESCVMGKTFEYLHQFNSSIPQTYRMAAMNEMIDSVENNGYRFDTMIVDLLSSDVFLYR